MPKAGYARDPMGQKSEVRRQKSEDRSQKAEARRQKQGVTVQPIDFVLLLASMVCMVLKLLYLRTA